MYSIVLGHAIPVDYSRVGAIDIQHASLSPWRLFLDIFSFNGQFSNNIFLVCSAWYLVDKGEVKRRKLENLVADNVAISLVFLIIFLAAGFELPMKLIVKQFFPMTMEYYWYISCYFFLYLFHPWLNIIINHTSKKQLLILSILFLAIYGFAGLFNRGIYYRTDLMGFIEVYFLTGYFKKWVQLEKYDFKKLAVEAGIGNIAILLFANFFSILTGVPSGPFAVLRVFTNPVLVFESILVFLVFLNLEWNAGNKTKRIIGFLSGLSMYIFCIHRNVLVRDYFQHPLFDRLSKYYVSDFIEVCIVLAYGVASIIFSTIMASIYKWLIHPVNNYIMAKLDGICWTMAKHVYDKIYEK